LINQGVMNAELGDAYIQTVENFQNALKAKKTVAS